MATRYGWSHGRRRADRRGEGHAVTHQLFVGEGATGNVVSTHDGCRAGAPGLDGEKGTRGRKTRKTEGEAALQRVMGETVWLVATKSPLSHARTHRLALYLF